MDQNKAYEAFRVRKFAQPSPVLLGPSDEGRNFGAEDDYARMQHCNCNYMEEDEDEASAVRFGQPNQQHEQQRVILHFDCDCFYAQVEEVRNPAVRQVPLGVTQKYLIVTCNYLARAAGVTKLMGIRDALARCPGLVLVSGEDLGPYRQASKAIHAVLSRYGPAEKLGLDETFVDVTEEVLRRIRSGVYDPPAPPPPLVGHLHTATCAVTADTSHRPQDLRAVPAAAVNAAATAAAVAAAITAAAVPPPASAARTAAGAELVNVGAAAVAVAAAAAAGTVVAESGGIDGSGDGGGGGGSSVNGVACGGCSSGRGGGNSPLVEGSWELLLVVGSVVAAEARAAVQSETGFRSSAGVATNKMLAKLVSGLHKPDDQTVLFPDQVWDFVGPLLVRALPGVGYKTEKLLTEQLGVATAADVRRYSQQQLVDKLGDKTGTLLWRLCRGQDASPVRPTGPPRSITVEDSFKSCTTWAAAEAVMQVLAPDLLQRLHDEYEENRRRPVTLTLKWRLRGGGWSRSSASCAMPLPAGAWASPPSQAQVDQLVRSALQLLQRQLGEPFTLSLINLGATNFKEDGGGDGGGGGRRGGGTIPDLFNRHSGRRRAANGAATGKATACGPPDGGGATAAAASAATAYVYDMIDMDEHPVAEPSSGGGRPDVWVACPDPSPDHAYGGARGPLPRPEDAVLRGGGDGGGGGLVAAAAAAAREAALSPDEARRVAEQSAARRRGYQGSGQLNVNAVLLSKSRERQLREAAARVSLGSSPMAAAAGSPVPYSPGLHPLPRQCLLPPPPPRHQPLPQQRPQPEHQQRQSWHPAPGGLHAERIPQPVSSVAGAEEPDAAAIAGAATTAAATAATARVEGPAPIGDPLVAPAPSAKRARLNSTAATPLLLFSGAGDSFAGRGASAAAGSGVHGVMALVGGGLHPHGLHSPGYTAGKGHQDRSDTVQHDPHSNPDPDSNPDLDAVICFGFSPTSADGFLCLHAAAQPITTATTTTTTPIGVHPDIEATGGSDVIAAARQSPAIMGGGEMGADADKAAPGTGTGTGTGMDWNLRGQRARELDLAVVSYRIVDLCDYDNDDDEGDDGVILLASTDGGGSGGGGGGGGGSSSSGGGGGGIFSWPDGWDGGREDESRHNVHTCELAHESRQGDGTPCAVHAAPAVRAVPAYLPASSGFGPGPASVSSGWNGWQSGGRLGSGSGSGTGNGTSTDTTTGVVGGSAEVLGALSDGPCAGAPLQQQVLPLRQEQEQDRGVWDGGKLRLQQQQAQFTTGVQQRQQHEEQQQEQQQQRDRQLQPPKQRQRQLQPPQQRQRQPCGLVFLHVDVDCFYCQVERLDDPNLVGVPLAVTQFNAGGFVAVSYEARAAGIRCGDGVGAGGRASIPYLKAMGAVSLAEAQRRCPGLVVRPMRTERYRRVAEQVHGLLRRFAPNGQVEKTSYDDFYLDVTAACGAGAGVSTVAGGGSSHRAVGLGLGIGTRVDGDVEEMEVRNRGQDADQDQEEGEEEEEEMDWATGGGNDVAEELLQGVVAGREDGEPPPRFSDDDATAAAAAAAAAADWDAVLEGANGGIKVMARESSGDGDNWAKRRRKMAVQECQPPPPPPQQQQQPPQQQRQPPPHPQQQPPPPPQQLPPQPQPSPHQQQPPQQQQPQQQPPPQPPHQPPPQQQSQQQPQRPLQERAGWGQLDQGQSADVTAPPRVHVAGGGGGGGGWANVEPWMRRGVEMAQQLRVALKDALGLTVSVGVAPTKLSARLAGPAHKPDAITVVPAARLREFMAGIRIKSVPSLAGKTGDHVVSELGVEHVGQLDAWPRHELIARFGPALGNLLAGLPYGGGGGGGGGACGGFVRERGPQKSILVERSFPAITRFSGLKEALVPMVGTLWERMVEDAVANRRSPNKLLLTWRQGYGAPKTKSGDVSVQILQALKAAAAAASPGTATPPPAGATATATAAAPPTSPAAAAAGATAPTAGSVSYPMSGGFSAASSGRWMEPGVVSSCTYQGCRALLEGAAAIFKLGLGNLRSAVQITRLAVAVSYGASDGVDRAAGQRPISAFTKQQQPLSPALPALPPPQHQQHRHYRQQQQGHHQHDNHHRDWATAAVFLPSAAAAAPGIPGPLSVLDLIRRDRPAAVAAEQAVMPTAAWMAPTPTPARGPGPSTGFAMRPSGAPSNVLSVVIEPSTPAEGQLAGRAGQNSGGGGGDEARGGRIFLGEDKRRREREDWDFSFAS